MNIASWKVERVTLALIAVGMLPAGLQAAFMPRDFYDEFPLGRGWIVADGGAYNEHLTRDTGGLFLALVIVTFWALWRAALARPVAIAWAVQGVLHLVYHLGDLDGYTGGDKVGMIGSLVFVPLLAAVALLAGARPPEPVQDSRR